MEKFLYQRFPLLELLILLKRLIIIKKPKIIGIRPGEKLHEEMVTASDALNTLEYSDYFCILSQFNKLKLNQKKTKYYPKICPENFTYVSDKNKFFLKINELKKLFEEFSKKN